MRFLILLFSISFTLPSHAITWKEFWEPFNNNPWEGIRYYPRPIRGNEICRKEVYREQYVPGDIYSPGYVRRWRETFEIPCR